MRSWYANIVNINFIGLSKKNELGEKNVVKNSFGNIIKVAGIHAAALQKTKQQ